MKNFTEKIFRKITQGFGILLAASMILTFSACESDEQEDTVKDRLWQGSGIPSIGVGRQKQEEEPVEQTGGGITICVDPGHGFDDAGASSTYVTECDERELTLRYALDLRTELEAMGYKVLMTHDGTAFPKTTEDDGNNKFNPYERAAYVNSQNVDYFISLHCDSYTDETVGGTRVYFCNTEIKTKDYSEDVANAISTSLNNAFESGMDARVLEMKPAESYAVIRETYTAGSLIEIGFITSPDDAAKIQDAEWQSKFVKAVAAGINDYFVSLG
ncbi:MAG: N-acetylmuramoyl-L-alanine amidase [Ruminococcaceae bacterium]|nr:N-acetylmuramoyl-L-alanine amidase [Oscillospiraceae bacterium]